MSKPIVIGLVAPKQAGKTTTLNILAEFAKVEESAFADKLKNTCVKVFGIERKHFDDQNLKEVAFDEPILLTRKHANLIAKEYGYDKYPTSDKAVSLISTELYSPRHVAQIVGTEILREVFDKNIHINNVKIHPNVITVISDTRFENEYTEMYKRDDISYFPVYVYRKEAEEAAKLSTHKSETEFFKFKDKCHLLDNNGTFKDLEINVNSFLNNVVYKKNE